MFQFLFYHVIWICPSIHDYHLQSFFFLIFKILPCQIGLQWFIEVIIPWEGVQKILEGNGSKQLVSGLNIPQYCISSYYLMFSSLWHSQISRNLYLAQQAHSVNHVLICLCLERRQILWIFKFIKCLAITERTQIYFPLPYSPPQFALLGMY